MISSSRIGTSGLRALGAMGGVIQNSIADRLCRVSRKCPPPGSHLVQNQTEGEQIRACVERLMPNLLRRQVGRRAECRASLRDRWGSSYLAEAGVFAGVVLPGLCPLHELGHAEVEYLDLPTAGDENVRRLDVAMNNPFSMR